MTNRLSIALVVASLLPAPAAHAQSTFTLRRAVFSVAGGEAVSANFRLRFTFGEPVAGAVATDPFVCNSGFWGGNGARPCIADLDDGGGGGHPDGGVTIDDLLYFLQEFEIGSLRADLDDGSGIGNRDGGVTIDDLLFFLYRFQVGC